MRAIKCTLLSLAITVFVFCCSKKEELIFAATDEHHFIQLNKNDNRFKVLYNGFNTAVGEYLLKGDSILLDYDENQFKNFSANDRLARVLLIENKKERVMSVDNHQRFCADIYFDER